jgi:hypothetical protein
VAVVGEDEDVFAGVSAAEADVVEAAVVAEGDGAVGVDAVLADPVVPVDDGDAAGEGLGVGGEPPTTANGSATQVSSRSAAPAARQALPRGPLPEGPCSSAPPTTRTPKRRSTDGDATDRSGGRGRMSVSQKPRSY